MKIKYLPVFLFCSLLFSLPVFSQKLIVDTTFNPTLNGEVRFVEILGDGKILIVGAFTTVNGTARNKMARLNADGSLDASFNADWLGGISPQSLNITAMKVLSDGKILVAGSLPIDGSCCGPKVRRLNADGSPDAAQTSTPYIGFQDTGFLIIRDVDQLSNGKILMCGKFTLPNNNQKPYLARYNNDGTYDSTFATTIDNECQDVEALPDGKYYVAGWFANVNGTPRERLLRFNADDSLDTSFNAQPMPGSSPAYYSKIKLESDGKIIAFRSTSGSTDLVTRLNSNGSLHTNIQVGVDELGDVVLQANGKFVVVGEIPLTFGYSTDLNRFNRDGTHDPSQPRMRFEGSGFPVYPKDAAFASDGKLVVGGNFTQVNDGTNGNISRTYLVRFSPQAIPIRPKYDFDGDGKDDIAVFRPSDRVWYLNQSNAGFSATQFGLSTDIPVAADWDGDGKADIAVFRDGAWYWLRSSDGVFAYKVSGQAGDFPTPLRNPTNTSHLVFRSTATPPNFYAQGAFQPNSSVVEFRNMTLMPNDKPVIGDYDGDGREDLAVFRDGSWYHMASNNLSTRHFQFGLAGDKPAVGDFDGDLRSDFAVFRPSEGIWYINQSHEGFYAVQFGISEDLPVPADYDGDGRTDIAVFRPSSGVWYIMKSTGGYHIEQFGLSGDIPAQLR